MLQLILLCRYNRNQHVNVAAYFVVSLTRKYNQICCYACGKSIADVIHFMYVIHLTFFLEKTTACQTKSFLTMIGKITNFTSNKFIDYNSVML